MILNLARGINVRGVGCWQTAVTLYRANGCETCVRRTKVILLSNVSTHVRAELSDHAQIITELISLGLDWSEAIN